MSDNLYLYRFDVLSAFASSEPNREFLMNKSEWNELGKLGDILTIYRTMTVEEKNNGLYGISWTTDINVANFFKEKYTRNLLTNAQERVIVELKIPKDDVIAYWTERQESEIVYICPKSHDYCNIW